jgi:hypothetical protein
MSDLLNEKPAEQTLKDYLVGLTPAQRVEVKAQAWAACDLPEGRIDIGDYEVEIVRRSSEAKMVSVFARVWDSDGDQIGFGDDGTVDIERFKFHGDLEIEVPDGTKREVTDEILGETYEVDNLEENVAGALLSGVTHTVKICGKILKSEHIIEGKVGSTVSTFYPEAGSGGGNTTVDGRLLYYTKNWNTGVSASSATHVYKDSVFDLIGSYNAGGNDYYINRIIFSFDTSTIGTDIISAAVLSPYYNGTSNTTESTYPANPNIFGWTLANDNDLVAGDYDGFDTTSYANMTLADFVSGGAGYKDFTLSEAGRNYISKTGVTVLGIRASNDINNTAPSARSHAQIYMADNGSNKPKLVVTHAPSTSIKTWNGIAKSNIKTFNGIAIANVKKINGIS